MSYRSNPLRSKRASSARQHGIALITALLIVALAATAAAAIVADEQISIRRTSNTLDSEQAYLYAAGIESWAIDVLGEDKKDNQFDSLDEDWASLLPPFQVDGGQISGYIEDAQGRFNLNNLVDSKGKKNNAQIVIFQNLLDNLKINEDLIPLLVDWLDSDIETTFPGGAEDNEYLGGDRPYRTANQLMAHPSELRLLLGMKDEIYARLLPYVTALPKINGQSTPINVNTAPAPVLQAIDRKLTLPQAETLIQSRESEPFEDVAVFTKALKQLIGEPTSGGESLSSNDASGNAKKSIASSGSNTDFDDGSHDKSSASNADFDDGSHDENPGTEENSADADSSSNAGYDVYSEYFILHADAQIGDSNARLDSLIIRPRSKKAETNGNNAAVENPQVDKPLKIQIVSRGWGL